MQQDPNIHINIGLAVRQKISEQGSTVAWLARQIGYDRSNMSKQLQNEHIYPELLLKISIALKTNFFEQYTKQYQQIVEKKQNNITFQNQQTVSRSFMQGTNIHIDTGLAIRQKMSEQGSSIAWLARQIGYDRSNLGKQLQNEHIFPELLLKISIALNTNFFEHYTNCFIQAVENK